MTDLEVIKKRIDEDSEDLRRSNGSFRLCEHRLILSLADRRALLAEVERLLASPAPPENKSA